MVEREDDRLAVFAAGGREGTRVFVCGQPEDTRLFVTTLPPGNERGVEVVSFSNDASTLEDDVEQHEATIVVVSPLARNYSDTIVARLARSARIVAVIGLVPPSGDYVKQVTLAGALDVLRTPVSQATVDALVANSSRWIREAGEQRQEAGWMAAIPGDVQKAVRAMGYRKGIWPSWSPKGGVGKTTLAANVAALLGVVAQIPTLLLDANMNGGHVDIHMGLEPKRRLLGLANLYQQRGRLTADDVRSFVSNYRGTALDILPGIVKVEQASNPALLTSQGAAFMEELLGLAGNMYEFVIADIGASPNVAIHRTVLANADGVLVVTTPDRCSVLDVRNVLDTLVELMGIDRARYALVVNKWSDDCGLKRKDITRVTKLAEAGLVPLERTGQMMFAVNNGEPFVLSHLGTKDAREQQVVEALAGVAQRVYPPLETIWRSRGKGVQTKKEGGFLNALDGLFG